MKHARCLPLSGSLCAYNLPVDLLLEQRNIDAHPEERNDRTWCYRVQEVEDPVGQDDAASHQGNAPLRFPL